jgi:FkbM family methyltransferase
MELDLGRLTDCFAYVFGAGEFEVARVFDMLAPQRSVALDVGANVGTTTTVFAGMRPEGRIVAFEPSWEMRAALERNVAINRLTNVAVEPFALGDVSALYSLREEMSGNPGSAYLVPVEDGAREAIRSTTLDDWSGGSTDVGFIKMDVEGFEHRVLLGGRALIDRCRPFMVLELNERALRRQGSSCDLVSSFLRDHDYTLMVLERGRLTPYVSEALVALSVFNIIAIPNVAPKRD